MSNVTRYIILCESCHRLSSCPRSYILVKIFKLSRQYFSSFNRNWTPFICTDLNLSLPSVKCCQDIAFSHRVYKVSDTVILGCFQILVVTGAIYVNKIMDCLYWKRNNLSYQENQNRPLKINKMLVLELARIIACTSNWPSYTRKK